MFRGAGDDDAVRVNVNGHVKSATHVEGIFVSPTFRRCRTLDVSLAVRRALLVTLILVSGARVKGQEAWTIIAGRVVDAKNLKDTGPLVGWSAYGFPDLPSKPHTKPRMNCFAAIPRYKSPLTAPLRGELEGVLRNAKTHEPNGYGSWAVNRAEREGFEPSVSLHPHWFSRPAQSATLSPLQVFPDFCWNRWQGRDDNRIGGEVARLTPIHMANPEDLI